MAQNYNILPTQIFLKKCSFSHTKPPITGDDFHPSDTLPSFLPLASSSSTPIHWPSAKSVAPTQRTVPEGATFWQVRWRWLTASLKHPGKSGGNNSISFLGGGGGLLYLFTVDVFWYYVYYMGVVKKVLHTNKTQLFEFKLLIACCRSLKFEVYGKNEHSKV